MVESLTCYLNNVVKRKDVEETLEEKCRELAGLLPRYHAGQSD